MGGGSDTSTQSSSPWSGQQPFLTDVMRQAQGMFGSGVGQQYYPGQTVAPFSPQSQQAFDMITQRALSGSPQERAFGGYLGNALNQQNIDPRAIMGGAQNAAAGVRPGMNMMEAAGMQGMNAGPNRMVGGAANALGHMTGYGGLGEAQQYAGGPGSAGLPPSANSAANQFATTAGGGYLGSNPYLDQMFKTASGRAGEAFNEQTLPGIASMFGSGGRTGGGIQQEVVGNAARQFGRDLQGMASDIYAPAYESERDRMLQGAQGGANMYTAERGLGNQLYLGERGLGQQAASQLGQLGLGQGGLDMQGLGLGLQAGQGMGQLGLGGVGAMNDLYGNVGTNQFRAGSLMPSYSGLQYGNMNQLLGVGGMMENQAQQLMNANQARFNFGQQSPWQMLGQYANIVHGMPSGYGTTSTTQPGGSPLAGAIGGGLAGFGAAGPWGAGIGALGGFLGS